ncbi:EthD domain-containing protein [Bradyrhizobium genosp. A]|uniref:EthD domain-containing protein n=1 Tax=Bradyrhizobium genosp. A TaxID=83626 RepID=UPI003CF7F19A
MIKVSIFLTRRPDLTREQFTQYWHDKHASLVMSLDSFTSSIRRYAQQHCLNDVPAGFPILPYDGVAEVWFDNLSSAITAFAHQDYASVVVRDEENFLDRTKTVMFLSSEERMV